VTELRQRGRPRSDSVRAAILDAAIAELKEKGYSALTIEGIAARACAGKQTIYRWWDSKADVVLDAMLELAASLIKVPDTGNLEDDLRAFLTATFRQRGLRPVLTGLMAQAQLDPVFAAAFRERFLFGRRAALRTILLAGRERGEIGPDVDLELLIDVVFGVLWYRLLVAHVPLDAATGPQLTDLLMRVVRGTGRVRRA
jgi:AcrR family transcriptional regulator